MREGWALLVLGEGKDEGEGGLCECGVMLGPWALDLLPSEDLATLSGCGSIRVNGEPAVSLSACLATVAQGSPLVAPRLPTRLPVGAVVVAIVVEDSFR